MRKKFLIATFSLCFLGLASCNTVVPPSATAPSTSLTTQKPSSSSSPVNEDVKISQIKLTADKTELIEGETLQLKVRFYLKMQQIKAILSHHQTKR